MKFEELKNALKINVAPVYLLHGADIFLIQKSIDLIIEAADIQSLSITKLDEGTAPSAVIAAARGISMFGKHAVILRGGAESVLGAELDKYTASPNSECVLILTASGDKAPSIKNAITVDCNPMSLETVVKLIANQLNSHGKKISAQAAQDLAKFCGNNYARINNEINKLAAFYKDSETISVEDLTQIVTPTEEYQIWNLSDRISKKDVASAERILKNLQQSGIDDYAIFAGLVSHFRRVFWSVSCKSPNETVAGFLKCNPYAVAAARRDARAINAQAAYEMCLDLEYKIKSGKVSINSALNLLSQNIALM